MKVLGVFFTEPTTIHFIKEISRIINLAPTSVRNQIRYLLKSGLIKKKPAKPFDGFAANRENDNFIFQKRIYNLTRLKELADYLTTSYYPKLIVVFGSYSIGEDVENSDIDIFVLSKTKKNLDLKKFEKKLKRQINPLVLNNFNKLDSNLKKKIWNGIVLYGGFNG